MDDLIAEAEVDESTAVADAEVEEEIEDSEPDEETDEADADEGDPDSEDEESDEPTAEEIEFNFGGKKLAIPKNASAEQVARELQAYASNVEAAHTKRSQAVAEMSKNLTTQIEASQNIARLDGDAMRSYSKAIALQDQIRELETVDFDRVRMQAPDEADEIINRVMQDLKVKKHQYQQAYGELSQKLTHVNQVRQSEVQRQKSEGRKWVESRIPGFSQKENEILEYAAQTYNVPKEMFTDWELNPIGMDMAHKAYLYDKLQAGMKSKGKQPAAAKVKPPVPAMKLGRGKPAEKDPAKMNMKEYVKWAAKEGM